MALVIITAFYTVSTVTQSTDMKVLWPFANCEPLLVPVCRDANVQQTHNLGDFYLFWSYKNVVQSTCRALPINPQKNASNNYSNSYLPKVQISTKICLKNVFYVLSFLLSGRFGDPCVG